MAFDRVETWLTEELPTEIRVFTPIQGVLCEPTFRAFFGPCPHTLRSFDPAETSSDGYHTKIEMQRALRSVQEKNCLKRCTQFF